MIQRKIRTDVLSLYVMYVMSVLPLSRSTEGGVSGHWSKYCNLYMYGVMNSVAGSVSLELHYLWCIFLSMYTVFFKLSVHHAHFLGDRGSPGSPKCSH